MHWHLLRPEHEQQQLRKLRQCLHRGQVVHDRNLLQRRANQLQRGVRQHAYGYEQLRHLRQQVRVGSIVRQWRVCGVRFRLDLLQRRLREHEHRREELRRVRPRVRQRQLLLQRRLLGYLVG